MSYPNTILAGETISVDWGNNITLALLEAGYVQLPNGSILDLSGAAQTDIPLLHAQEDLIIDAIILLYTEASSVNAGVAVKVGKETDDDHFASETSEISKSQWYEKSVTLINEDLDAGDTLVVANAGGKVGTGNIIVCVYYHKKAA